MGMKHSTFKSFGYAFQGIKTALKNEPNLRIHLIFAIFALLFGAYLRLSNLEWLILSFTIFWVISLELLNTVLEELVDLVSPEIKNHAKVAKDVSAAIVLLSAFLSIIVGLILFLPKLILLVFSS
jgi:undecaprenol kinase